MRAAVAGGTGLIGSYLLKALNKDRDVQSVIALSRSEHTDFEKVKWRNADLGVVEDIADQIKGCKTAFCCLGTTMKKAGSKDAFRTVDKSYVLNFARAAQKAGINCFAVVSAIGADPNSSVFYNKVKGETEEELKKMGFDQLVIAQPSILLGARKEKRFGEKVGQILMQAVSPLLVGSLKKYKPIRSKDVANAILKSSKNPSNGAISLTYEEILAFR
ncbi:MAG: NAD(P)H-binding protein [Cryomorphaceae bacterium]|nr:NAD(P)H-binding protein [Flavobacteriales bacterium]